MSGRAPPGPLPALRCRRRLDWAMTATGEEPGGAPDSYCCRFCPRPGATRLLVSADENGTVKLWDTARSPPALLREVAAHTNAVHELDWSSDGRHLLSAAGDRVIRLWDAERLTLLTEFRRHSRTVKTVTFLPEDPSVFASGGRDGTVQVWDVRVAKQISHEILPLQSKKAGRPNASAPASVTSLVFRDDRHLLSGTSGDSCVRVWDLRRTYSSGRRQPVPLWQLPGPAPDRGVVTLVADRPSGQLYVSRINDAIQRYSLTNWTADSAGTFSGHRCGSFYVRACLSPDGGLLVSGSSDQAGYVWSTTAGGAAAARLPGHQDEVTCVTWRADGTMLVTMCDDLYLRVWRADLDLPEPAADSEDAVMERLPAPGPPLPRYALCRETGTRWRPGRACRTSAPAGRQAAPPSGRPRKQRPAPAAGSSAFLAGWLSGSGRTLTRTSPRKRPVREGERTPEKTRPETPVSSQGFSFTFSPSKRQDGAARLSPEKQGCASDVTTPTGRSFTSRLSSLSPTKKLSITLAKSPSKAGPSAERLSKTASAASSPSGSPPKSGSPGDGACARPPLAETSASELNTPVRRSPRKTAGTPSRLSGADGADGSPHTPARCSPRKPAAKLLFSASPGVSAECGTPESGRRQRPSALYRSPTAGLPNWVADGVSPHRPAPEPPRRPPRPDWLTELSQRKRAQASPAATPPAKRTRRGAAARRQTPR